MRLSKFSFLAAFAVIVGGLSFLFFGSNNSKVATETFTECVRKNDYICVVDTLKKYPPETVPRNYNKNIAITLAQLGETDSAIAAFQVETNPPTKKIMAGAIVAYLIASEQEERLASFRSLLTSHDMNLWALSYAESNLRNAAKRFRDKSYSAYTDYIEQNLTELGSEQIWNGIMAKMAWRDSQRLYHFSRKISPASLRQYVERNTPKYYQRWILKHREKIETVAGSGTQSDLEKLILAKLSGLGNRNYQLFNYYSGSLSWLEKLAEQDNIEVARKITSTILGAVDPNAESSCISGLYGSAAYLYSRIGDKQRALEYLNDGKPFIPHISIDLSSDGKCPQGHIEFLRGLRLAIGDTNELSRIDSEVGASSVNREIDKRVLDFISHLNTGFRMMGACHTTPKTRKIVLKHIVESRKRSGNLGIYPLINAMETAFRLGDVSLAMDYAQSAVSFADGVKNENHRHRVIEHIKSKIVGREFSSGWLYHHKFVAC